MRDVAVIMLQPFSLTSSTGRREKDPLSQISEGITSKHKVEIAAPQLVAGLLRGVKTNLQISCLSLYGQEVRVVSICSLELKAISTKAAPFLVCC